MDYYRHLLSKVDVIAFPYQDAADWNVAADLDEAKQRVYRVGLNEEMFQPTDVREDRLYATETDTQAKAWLVANLDLDWYSAKRRRFVVEPVCSRLSSAEDSLSLIRFRLLERLDAFIREETDKQTEAVFKDLYAAGNLGFFRESRRCVFEIPPAIKRSQVRALVHKDNSPIMRNLFDFQPDEDNAYEKEVALFLDQSDEVLWWKRNVVAREEFSIQGYRRNLIYPDYIVQLVWNEKTQPRFLIVESKGAQLKGNADTVYKKDVARYFGLLGKHVPW